MKLEKDTIYVVLLLVHLKEQRTDRQSEKISFCLFSPLLAFPDKSDIL